MGFHDYYLHVSDRCLWLDACEQVLLRASSPTGCAYDKLVAVLAKSHTERHTATALGQSFVKRFLIVGHAFDPINATSEKATCAAHNLSAYLTRR
jgi:hypothetical protein